MMSISTIATSGERSRMEIASRPVVAVSTRMPRRSSALDSAKMLRVSSSTTSTVRPASISSELCRRSSMRFLSSGRSSATWCRNSAVSSYSRSGEAAPLTTMLRAMVCRRASSSGVRSRPVNTTTGRSASASSFWISSSTSKPEMSGRRRSSTMQSKRCSRSLSSAPRPESAVAISTSGWARSSLTPNRSASLSSAISSRFLRGRT